MKQAKGLTTFELLITLAIAGIMFVMGYAAYHDWVINVKLTNDRDQLKSVLLRTQQLATAAAGSTSWGLHLEKDHYVMFPGDFYDENNSQNKTWSLYGAQVQNASTTFSSGGGPRVSDVVFAKFTGETYNTGTIILEVPFNNTVTKSVIVAESGQIY